MIFIKNITNHVEAKFDTSNHELDGSLQKVKVKM